MSKKPVLITTEKDNIFLQYRRKMLLLMFAVFALLTFGFAKAIYAQPFTKNLVNETVPYGDDYYFKGVVTDYCEIQWRAGATLYVEPVPNMSDKDIRDLGKYVLVYSDENTILDIVSEDEIKKCNLAVASERIFIIIAYFAIMLCVIGFIVKKINAKKISRLNTIAEEVRSKMIEEKEDEKQEVATSSVSESTVTVEESQDTKEEEESSNAEQS